MNGGSNVLELIKVGKCFGTVQAVSDVSFEVRQGEIFTLLGPSGCGKSTTLRIVGGLEYPESGEIRLKGKTIVNAETGTFTAPDHRNMGMVFQSYAVWPHMTVFENIAFPLRVRHESRLVVRKKVMEALELVGLANRAMEYPWQFSGGMQQRVSLARALVYAPDILLLDEPLSNLDAKLREQMRLELRSLQRRLGLTILFVTHDQAEAMILSTRIAVMALGKLEQIGTPNQVYERPATPFVRDFLGQSVVLSGIARRNGDLVCVDLRLGVSIAVPGTDDEAFDGRAVCVACRAESIKIHLNTDPASERIPGVVEDMTYMGDRMDYHVRAADKLLTVRGSLEQLYPIGTKVYLSLSQRGMTVWPDGN